MGKSKIIKSNTSQDDVKKQSNHIFLKPSTTKKPFTTSKSTTKNKKDPPTKKPKTISESERDNEIRKDKVNNRHIEYTGHITDTKQVWPDIFKNEYEKLFWNAQNIYDEEMSDEDDDYEENYFSEYQLDEEDKSVNNNQNNVNNINRINKAVSKVTSKTNVNRKESARSNSKLGSVNNNVNNSTSDLNVVNNAVDNNKYDFVHFLKSVTGRPVRTPVNSSRHDNNSAAKDDNWPNFSYHRVTVNPNKEKFKNLSKAFIVVSEISPRNNVTIIKTNMNNVADENHESERRMKSTESESQRTESIVHNEVSI